LTDYKITSVTLSHCLSVSKHSYGRKFDLILMKFCTVIRCWIELSRVSSLF